MRRYLFKIGDNAIKHVISITVTRKPRESTQSTNILGNMLVDIGNVKSFLTVSIGFLDQATLDIILAAMEQGLFEVTYVEPRAAAQKTAKFYCANINIPAAIKHGDTYYYEGVTLSLEEA